MRIVYTPEDGTGRDFLFKPRKLFSFDSEAIEEVGGRVWGNYDEFLEALAEKKGRALRAALWHELRQERPDLTFYEVVVRPAELQSYYDDEEIAEMRALAESPDAPEELRAMVLAVLGKGDEGEPSENSDSDTDSPSPATTSED